MGTMTVLTVLLTIIQFGILFYLFFKVGKISKILEQQQLENNEMLVIVKKINEQANKVS